MKNFFKLYGSCIKIALAGALAYRLNFVLTSLLALILNALFPLVTLLIYNAGASFPGWDIYEVLLLQSVFMMSSGLTYLMCEGVMWATMQHVREGNFEIVLLKPLSPLTYLIATTFQPEVLSMLIAGSVLFGVSAAYTEIAGALAVLQFLILFFAGVCVMVGGQMIVAATSFKWVGNSRLFDINESVMTFGKYPVTIFPQAIRAVATFVIPVGMVAFFPASALLGRADRTAFAAVIPCVLFMLFGIWLYKFMIKKYEGVGG
jgi:ABC-2 type transport system permease protein